MTELQKLEDTVIVLGRALDEYKIKYKRLLEFVKECATQESYMKQFLNKHVIDFKDHFDSKATDLLKEIGELDE